ncbi:MAG: pyridoxal 5'-phosphate synthase glutaminase subunit PdxT, partial [Methanoregula sp.]
ALQGDVSEHIEAFTAALARRGGMESSVVEVRSPADLSGCSALALPGGESTTISRLIDKNGLYEPIRTFPGGIFATCAGMVLMATDAGDSRVHTLNLIDMKVDRNAFGRQKESFEADIPVTGLDGGPFHAVFIRAPVATTAGSGVHVLAALDQGIVAVEKGRYTALAFHPELGGDLRLHERFLKNLGI